MPPSFFVLRAHKRLIDDQPDLPRVRNRRLLANRRAGMERRGRTAPSTGSVTTAMSEARALVREGKFNEALEILRPQLKADVAEANALFLLGLAATGAAQQPDIAEAERDALLDEAIAAFRTMLIDRPDLVRVRLELARAFFLKGQDNLSRDHFERVLAGNPPQEVAANVRRFLSEIRARRRWSMYLSTAVAPDTNIGGASDERIIYIRGLPFRRDAEDLTTSGVGSRYGRAESISIPWVTGCGSAPGLTSRGGNTPGVGSINWSYRATLARAGWRAATRM